MDKSLNIKLMLGAIVAILVLGGLLLTEFQQKTYLTQTQKQQAAREEFEKKSPARLAIGIKKLLQARSFEITDTQTYNMLGCQYSSIYTGNRNNEEEFAYNTTDFQNNAIFKEICPKDYERLMSVYNEQTYWTKDKTYRKRNTEGDFTEQATGSSQLLARPSEYLSKYFKAYRDLPLIERTTKSGDNTLLQITTTEEKTKTQFNITLTPDNTITLMNYVITNTDSSLSETRGDLKINYQPKEARPAQFLTGSLSKDWLIKQIESLDHTIILTNQNNSLKIDGKYKELKLTWSDQSKKDYSCKLQTQICYDQYNQTIQILKDYIRDNYSEIKSGECLKLRQLTVEQINNKNQMLTLTIANGDATDIYDGKIEIDTDTTTGKTVLTKYGNNFTCYETKVPTLTSITVFENIVARFNLN